MSCFLFNSFDNKSRKKGTSEKNERKDVGKGRADFEDNISQYLEQVLECDNGSYCYL